MINIKCKFESLALSTHVEIQVFLPIRVSFLDKEKNLGDLYKVKEPFKTVYLLHGAWDCADQWIENTSVMRLAQDRNLALVIPSVGNSFYTNTLDNMKYFDYFIEEVVGFARNMFPLSAKREDNYLCGMSMGGYGCFKSALTYPEMFSKIATMSPVVDIAYSSKIISQLGVNSNETMGPWQTLTGSDKDLKVMLDKALAANANLPEILMIVGEFDYLLKCVKDFDKHLTGLNIEHSFRHYPEGMHDWDFWDKHVEECLDWIVGK